MKSVLLVDDDRAFVRSAREALLSGGKRLRVLAAGGAAEALERVQQTALDLVVVDLDAPAVDGLSLVDRLAQAWPQLPVIATTASAETEARASALGVRRTVLEPVDAGDLARTIVEAISVPSSYVSGITLASFVQLVHHERKTCTLRATSADVPPRSGDLHFVAGELVNARLGAQDGLAAAYEILAWSGATLELEEARAVEHAIRMPLENVLMQSLVLEDERTAARSDDEETETEVFPPPDVRATITGEDRERFEAIARALRGEVPEVEGVAVLDQNGTIVFASAGLDPRLGPLLSGLVGMAETSASGTGRGAFRRATVEAAGGRVIVASIDDAHYAVAVARAEARLGLLYLALDDAIRAWSGLLLVLACREA